MKNKYNLTPEEVLEELGLEEDDYDNEYHQAGELCMKFLNNALSEDQKKQMDLVELATKILDNQKRGEKFSQTIDRLNLLDQEMQMAIRKDEIPKLIEQNGKFYLSKSDMKKPEEKMVPREILLQRERELRKRKDSDLEEKGREEREKAKRVYIPALKKSPKDSDLEAWHSDILIVHNSDLDLSINWYIVDKIFSFTKRGLLRRINQVIGNMEQDIKALVSTENESDYSQALYNKAIVKMFHVEDHQYKGEMALEEIYKRYHELIEGIAEDLGENTLEMYKIQGSPDKIVCLAIVKPEYQEDGEPVSDFIYNEESEDPLFQTMFDVLVKNTKDSLASYNQCVESETQTRKKKGLGENEARMQAHKACQREIIAKKGDSGKKATSKKEKVMIDQFLNSLEIYEDSEEEEKTPFDDDPFDLAIENIRNSLPTSPYYTFVSFGRELENAMPSVKQFNTKEELDAYMKGLEDGIGWLDAYLFDLEINKEKTKIRFYPQGFSP